MALRDRLGLRPPLQAQLAQPLAGRTSTQSRGVAVRERRDPTAATLPLSYQTKGAPMLPEWDAAAAYRWAYIANVWVYACVRALATDLAGLPFRAGADPDKPSDFNPKARLAQLLGPPPNGPAPKLSARRLWAWSIAQRIVTGRFAWELELTQGRIAAMWPLVSAKLKAVPSERGTEWFSGFRYGREDRPTNLRPEQVFYAWNPSQDDFRQPESALQAARLDISVAVMQDRYDYAFLRNDARPAAVVVTQAFAERSEYDAFRDQWRAEHGGVDNAGKTAFLEAEGGEEGVAGAIAVTTLGLSQKDAVFIERYQAKVNGICVALGVPMSRLDASGRTFSNADAEGVHYWTGIRNLAADLQDDINLDLAPRLGSEVGWFDFSNVAALKPEPKYQRVGLPALVGPVMTQNEGRAEIGLPGVGPSGDRLVDPVALTLANTGLAAQPDPAAVAQTIVDAASELITAQVDSAIGRALGPGQARGQHREEPPPETADLDAEEIRKAKIWRATDAQAKALERVWERSWSGMFARQERSTLSRLRGKRGRQAIDAETRAVNPDSVFDASSWQDESEQMAARLYESVVAVGGPKLAERFGLSFDVDAPYVDRFITGRAKDLAGQVTETTYEAIRSQLADGVAAGESIEELAARLRHVFAVATDSRATLIARTEVLSAYNGSANLVANELGGDVIGGKEWIATRDSRTRDAHAEADGQVVPVDGTFTVGGDDYDYPSDPNCRCTVAFLTPAEMGSRGVVPQTRDGQVPLAMVRRLATRVAFGGSSTNEAIRALKPGRFIVRDRSGLITMIGDTDGVRRIVRDAEGRVIEARGEWSLLRLVRDDRGEIAALREEAS